MNTPGKFQNQTISLHLEKLYFHNCLFERLICFFFSFNWIISAVVFLRSLSTTSLYKAFPRSSRQCPLTSSDRYS